MRAGNLRHRITFQQLTVANDTYGHSNETWTNQINTRAAIWPLRGVEQIEALKLDNEVTHKIRVRYHKDIHPKMRIKFEDKRKDSTRYFDIQSLLNFDERNKYYDILATEEI